MKTSIFLLSGLAWAQHVAAACCRANQCLKAIVESDLGVEDCSANLIVTVTPEVATVTETGDSIQSFTVTTEKLDAVTVTETSTVSTTTVVATDSATVTASTETVVQLVTETDTTTTTSTRTINYIILRRQASIESAPVLPTYAEQCLSWDKYVSACKCAGVTPVTVTAKAATTTVMQGEVMTVTVPTTVTRSSTATVIEPLTATTTEVTSDITSVTATAFLTQTTVFTQTVTIPVVTTRTVVTTF